ncbi:MAG: hypothetical protein ACW97P_06525 [Candidatus Hodarchaeales archaeon]|jgi:glycerol uptake facilitator-like aquaporin
MTYEFRDEDANVIENVGNKAFFLALFFAFGGLILIIIAGINEDNYSNGIVFWLVLQGILQVAIGILFLRPSDNFTNVATTEGRDIEELMTGLKEMAWGFKMFVYFLLATVIIDAILIVGYEF